MPPDDLAPSDPRTPISQSLKRQIAEQLAMIPDGRRGALLLIADEQSVRWMVAGYIDDEQRWKVAADAGVVWAGERKGKFSGRVLLEGSW